MLPWGRGQCGWAAVSALPRSGRTQRSAHTTQALPVGSKHSDYATHKDTQRYAQHKRITHAMRDWLPTMFDHIEPWFSDVDIDAGSRGLNVIQERLDASEFGIIVVTPENLNKPWLVFEAGALSN